MENIKVSVKHNDWSEVFDMLVELGVTHRTYKEVYQDNNGWLFVYKDTVWLGLFPHERKECREVSFSELKDMVVLNRNSINDATHITTDDVWKFYIGHDTYCYERKNGVIGWHKEDSKCYDLKPIEENEMKEFLVNHNDKWTLQLLDSDTQENSYRVAVPDGAEVLKVFFGCESGFCFYKDNYTKIWQDFVEKPYWGTIYDNTTAKIAGEILWQRSEIEPLNDQCAETIKATIDGVEAFNAIANDIDVQYRFAGGWWKDYTQDLNHDSSNLKAVDFLCGHCEFRYKPKTIVVNGVEYEDEQKAVKVVQDYFKGYIK